jgi:hypothetical protein
MSDPSAPKDGYHKVKFKDGGYYEGQWVDGLPSGEGKSRDPQGNVYTGTFLKVWYYSRQTFINIHLAHTHLSFCIAVLSCKLS